jgi:hypothetical protein
MIWRIPRGEVTALAAPANKYHASKVAVNGITFDSKKEAARWRELEEMERAGEIIDLKRQVPFELIQAFECSGKKFRPTKYVADFAYVSAEDGKYVVEDVKSPATRTRLYLLKKKLMALVHGIIIKEV